MVKGIVQTHNRPHTGGFIHPCGQENPKTTPSRQDSSACLPSVYDSRPLSQRAHRTRPWKEVKGVFVKLTKRKPEITFENLGSLWSLRTIRLRRDRPSTETEFSERTPRLYLRVEDWFIQRTHKATNTHPASSPLAPEWGHDTQTWNPPFYLPDWVCQQAKRQGSIPRSDPRIESKGPQLILQCGVGHSTSDTYFLEKGGGGGRKPGVLSPPQSPAPIHIFSCGTTTMYGLSDLCQECMDELDKPKVLLETVSQPPKWNLWVPFQKINSFSRFLHSNRNMEKMSSFQVFPQFSLEPRFDPRSQLKHHVLDKSFPHSTLPELNTGPGSG